MPHSTLSDEPPASHLDLLKELRLKAQTAAVSLSCSSILAGRSSDSDEFSDVAFYSGELEDEERLQESIISKLGLGKFMEVGEVSEILSLNLISSQIFLDCVWMDL